MISSMTGYGKGSVSKGDLTIETEIKSVNSRYLDLSLRLPKFLLSKEFEVREKIKSRIRRGKVYVSVAVRKGEFEERFNEVDPAGIKFVVNLLSEIKKSAKIRQSLSLSDLLLFQNMLFKDDSEQASEEFTLVLQSIDAAIDELNKMRDAEGSELEKDLRKRISLIDEAVSKVEKGSDESVKQYFDKLKEKAKNLMSELSNNEDRLNMELAILAERSDITEECVRLRSHMKMFLETLLKPEDAGRRLNFILQEMNREANTINSKTVSSEISHNGISIKEEIEKIREQIQNIE